MKQRNNLMMISVWTVALAMGAWGSAFGDDKTAAPSTSPGPNGVLRTIEIQKLDPKIYGLDVKKISEEVLSQRPKVGAYLYEERSYRPVGEMIYTQKYPFFTEDTSKLTDALVDGLNDGSLRDLLLGALKSDCGHELDGIISEAITRATGDQSLEKNKLAKRALDKMGPDIVKMAVNSYKNSAAKPEYKNSVINYLSKFTRTKAKDLNFDSEEAQILEQFWKDVATESHPDGESKSPSNDSTAPTAGDSAKGDDVTAIFKTATRALETIKHAKTMASLRKAMPNGMSETFTSGEYMSKRLWQPNEMSFSNVGIYEQLIKARPNGTYLEMRRVDPLSHFAELTGKTPFGKCGINIKSAVSKMLKAAGKDHGGTPDTALDAIKASPYGLPLDK